MKILLVQGDVDSLKEILSILQKHSYKTIPSNSTSEAITYLQSYSSIKIVICDIMMPQQDSFGLLRYLRDNLRFNHIPVIVTSAIDDEKSVLKCIKLGARDYILKPAKEEILISKIQRVIEEGFGTVLIVDNNESILNLLNQIIERNKYKTLSAKSAKRALEVLKSSKVNLVISKIFLPDLNGFELLVEIKHRHPNIPVVLIVDKSGKFQKRYVIEAGADGFITRPFNSTQISRTLKSLVVSSKVKR